MKQDQITIYFKKGSAIMFRDVKSFKIVGNRLIFTHRDGDYRKEATFFLDAIAGWDH